MILAMSAGLTLASAINSDSVGRICNISSPWRTTPPRVVTRTLFTIPVAVKADYLYLTHFLINENNLTKQLLPVYKGFYGPDDDFNNITGEEFIFSEDFYFKSFKKAGVNEPRVMQEDMLNNLVAVLYRAKKKGYDTAINKDGDARETFNQYKCSYIAENYISRWPMNMKLAVFTWYETCRQNMIESNPEIFGGGSGEPAKYGLLSVMRVIAEGGIHGTFENVQKMYVKMWMIELNEKAEESKRAEKIK